MNHKTIVTPVNLAALLGPVAVMLGTYFLIETMDFFLLLLILYLMTALWVIWAVRKSLCKVGLIPLGFILSMLGPHIIETQNTGADQYTRSMVVSLIYAIPWGIITLIAALVVLTRTKKNSSEQRKKAKKK